MSESRKELKLLSPVGGPSLVYKWPLQQISRGKCAVDEAAELLDTIRCVVAEHPQLTETPLKNCTLNIIISDYDEMKKLCDLYNTHVRTLVNQTNATHREPASKALLMVILQRTYSHAVYDPEKLNHYQPFTPEVYGETKYDMIDQIIEEVPLKNGDTFLDLGSGVGQVVLQVAAQNKCRICYGIEQASTPNSYAKRMIPHFTHWMKFFGKPYSEFKLHEGDFLDEKYRKIIQKSTMIFVNNYAFGPTLNHKLKERFSQLPEGVKIISSCEFRPINFRITTRNITDVGTILRVREIHPRTPGSVSWTNNDVCYFIHTIDRSYLEEYVRQQKVKYGDKLDSLFKNTDRKIRERADDDIDIPALSVEDDRRVHLLSHLTEVEIPKVTTHTAFFELLQNHLEQYMSQASSTYGEAALAVELEQAKLNKERLELELEHADSRIDGEETIALLNLDKRLTELGVKAREPGEIGKELLFHLHSHRALSRRYDRLTTDVSSLQNVIKSTLVTQLSRWQSRRNKMLSHCDEIASSQYLYHDILQQLPGYNIAVLAAACRKELTCLTEKQKSLAAITESVTGLEKENVKLENDLKSRADEKVPTSKASTDGFRPTTESSQKQQPRPSTPTATKKTPTESRPPVNPPTAQIVKIPAELTKQRPKLSVMIEKPHFPHGIPEALLHAKDGSMSHIDAILARNGLAQYVENRPGSSGAKQRTEQHKKQQQQLSSYLAKELMMASTPHPTLEVLSDATSRSKTPFTTSTQPYHKDMLTQQQKHINSINSLLVQKQREPTTASPQQPTTKPSSSSSSSQQQPKQQLQVQTPQPVPTEQQVRSEECVLGSGTVPQQKQQQQPPPASSQSQITTTATRPNTEKQSMLKTTSPKLQLTTKQQSKQTVMVPHYMLDKDYVHSKVQVDPFSMIQQAKDHHVRAPAPKTATSSGGTSAGVQQPSVPSSLTSSQNSYFSVYGEGSQDLGYMATFPTETRHNHRIQKPKHKYPFQFLHQVFLTGSAIMAQNLREQHPNIRPEYYNELLAKSNFNPYTYFEYISKFEGFDRKLEQFYRARPDIAEKCKTRDQKLAEKRVATAGPPSRSLSGHGYNPVPISQPLSRIHKDPPSLPRAPPTIIESSVIPSKKESRNPAQTGNSQSITLTSNAVPADLKLTKPSMEPIKSPQNYSFKSPTFPHAKISESPSKSPAKRTETGLQYHHLSVDSFRQDTNKAKIRRKNMSSHNSNVKSHRPEPEKISPNKEAILKGPVKANEDPEVTEAAMVIMQLMQKKSGEHVKSVRQESDNNSFKSEIKVEQPSGKDTISKEYHRVYHNQQLKDTTNKKHETNNKKDNRNNPFYHREHSRPARNEMTTPLQSKESRDNASNHVTSRPRSHVTGEKRPLSRTEYRPNNNIPPSLRETVPPNLREPPLPALREPHAKAESHPDTRTVRDNNPPVLKEYHINNHLGSHLITTRESQGQAVREQSSNRSRHSSGTQDKVRSREASFNSEIGQARDRQSSGSHRHHNNKPSEIYYSSTKSSNAKHYNDASKTSSLSNKNNPIAINKGAPQIPHDKDQLDKLHTPPPKMPDLNKQPAEITKSKDIQNELKSSVPNAIKPPLHNPRTPHIITTASIPPPELKKARNFEMQQHSPRELPSQPPEMRIAPAHSSVYLPQPINNRPEALSKKSDFCNSRLEGNGKKSDYNRGDNSSGRTDGNPKKSDYLNNRSEFLSDSRTKIEVKTGPHVKKISVKENPKLQVVTKSDKDKKAEIQMNLLTSANLAYKFEGSPDNNTPKKVFQRASPDKETLSSPELTIAEESGNLKGSRDLARSIPSPDSSSTVVTSADSSNIPEKQQNGGTTGVLGYVLEDVSPPSTSPQHTKRDISKEGLMEALMNNKRRKIEPTSRQLLAKQTTKGDGNNDNNNSVSKQLKYSYNNDGGNNNTNNNNAGSGSDDKTSAIAIKSGVIGGNGGGGGEPNSNNNSNNISVGGNNNNNSNNNPNHGYNTNSNKVYSSDNVLVSRYLSGDKIYPSHDTCKLEARHLDERPIQSQDLSSSSTELSDKTKLSDQGQDS